MKQITIIFSLVMGFAAGSLIASKGNELAKDSYSNFVKEIQRVNQLNQKQAAPTLPEISQELPLDVDPNLKLHN